MPVLDAPAGRSGPLVGKTRARVRAHLDAGADHVCLQVLESDPNGLPLAGWRALAPAVLGR
jgi:hypothetical protein